MHRASDLTELKAWSKHVEIGNPAIKKAIRSAWKRQLGDLCQLCGCRMHFEIKFLKHRHFATIDHIIARGLGGNNSLDNIQIICKECNNTKSIDEYHQMPPDDA